MAKYLVLLTVVITGFAVAGNAHSRKARKKHKTPVAATTPAITSVSITHTACFGRCPNYTVTIDDKGMVTYEGKRFTTFTGTYRNNAGASVTLPILKQFEQYRADTCHSYETRIPDVPCINYNLTVNGKVQTVYNANFGPSFLRILADDIGQISAVDSSWTKIADGPKDQ